MKLICLDKGLFAEVDDEDFERLNVHRWRASWRKSSQTFYAERNCYITGKLLTIGLHREILGFTPTRTTQIDHKDHDGLNNQKHNLRICTVSQNQANSKKPTRKLTKPTSQYKGVYFDKSRGLWLARIQVNKHVKNLGRFQEELQAAMAYNAAAEKYFGEFMNGNVIPSDIIQISTGGHDPIALLEGSPDFNWNK